MTATAPWSIIVIPAGQSFNVSAAGNSQLTATPLTGGVNEVSYSPVGGGVILPASANQEVIIYSTASVDVLVYPPFGAALQGLSANAPVTLAPGTRATFACKSPTLWLYG
jgi:hypothetical protein